MNSTLPPLSNKRIKPLSLYLLILMFIIELGLPARMPELALPAFYVQYAGDVLWAMAVYFALSMVLDRLSTRKIFTLTIGVAYVIELSQLIQADWLVSLRNTPPMGLFLGHGFLWSDLVCYTLGVSVSAGAEHLILKGNPRLQKTRA